MGTENQKNQSINKNKGKAKEEKKINRCEQNQI